MASEPARPLPGRVVLAELTEAERADLGRRLLGRDVRVPLEEAAADLGLWPVDAAELAREAAERHTARLVAEGKVIPAAVPHREVDAPVPPDCGVRLSEYVIAGRE